MKRPSLQFYPGDWQSNPKLRRCSHAEKGIWLDVLCILHDQDEYGVIRWPLREIAIAVHCKASALQKLVDKNVLKGADSGPCEPFIFVPRHGRKDGDPVTLIEPQEGPIWYSSRMVRDEYVRKVRAENEPKAAPKVPMGEGLGAHPTDHPSRARVSSSASTSDNKDQKKEKRADKPLDPRVQHPAIQAVWKIRGKYPLKELWDMVIETVGDEPDVDRMKKCWVSWRGRGFSPENYGWLTDWYINGEGISSNGTNTQDNQLRRPSAAEKNSSQLVRNLAVVENLRREGRGNTD